MGGIESDDAYVGFPTTARRDRHDAVRILRPFELRILFRRQPKRVHLRLAAALHDLGESNGFAPCTHHRLLRQSVFSQTLQKIARETRELARISEENNRKFFAVSGKHYSVSAVIARIFICVNSRGFAGGCMTRINRKDAKALSSIRRNPSLRLRIFALGSLGFSLA
jgi:hypothetical protein